MRSIVKWFNLTLNYCCVILYGTTFGHFLAPSPPMHTHTPPSSIPFPPRSIQTVYLCPVSLQRTTCSSECSLFEFCRQKPREQTGQLLPSQCSDHLWSRVCHGPTVPWSSHLVCLSRYPGPLSNGLLRDSVWSFDTLSGRYQDQETVHLGAVLHPQRTLSVATTGRLPGCLPRAHIHHLQSRRNPDRICLYPLSLSFCDRNLGLHLRCVCVGYFHIFWQVEAFGNHQREAQSALCIVVLKTGVSCAWKAYVMV